MKNFGMKQIISVLLVIIAGVGTRFVCSRFSETGMELNVALRTTAEETNKGLPVMIDDETRIDSLSSGDGFLQYNYSMVKHTGKDLDLERIKSDLRPKILEQIRKNKGMQIFRENGVKLIYSYRDKNREALFSLEFTKDDYGK